MVAVIALLVIIPTNPGAISVKSAKREDIMSSRTAVANLIACDAKKVVIQPQRVQIPPKLVSRVTQATIVMNLD